jgi:hypothetical protein
MVVVLEKTAYGVTILHGRTEEEWLVVPWWPCRGETIRTIAPAKLPREWVDECARFADDEYRLKDIPAVQNPRGIPRSFESGPTPVRPVAAAARRPGARSLAPPQTSRPRTCLL